MTVTGTNGGSLAVSYSPMNYIVRMNAKGNENLKALYNYHLAAKALMQRAYRSPGTLFQQVKKGVSQNQ